MPAHSMHWPKAIGLAAASLIAILTFSGCTAYTGYTLPPERAQYTLTMDQGDIHTEWKFWSSKVTEDETPQGYLCVEAMQESVTGKVPSPCRAEPLIFLRYNAGVGLDNAVPAPGAGAIHVTADRQAPDAPPVAGLKLWVSTDDGSNWQVVRVNQLVGSKGAFIGTITYPKLAATTGAVSLRAEAWDADGNRVNQTIEKAYFLRAP